MGPVFNIGDKVWCFHQGHYYDAKCIAVKPAGKGDYLYRIHYIGWKPKWDEWISHKADRIKGYSERKASEPVMKQKGRPRRPKKGRAKVPEVVVESKSEESTEAEPVPSTSTEDEPMEVTNTTVIEETKPPETVKAPSAEGEKVDEPFPKLLENNQTNFIGIKIPFSMEDLLRDDYFQICMLKKLPIIPALHTVHEILDEYQKDKIKTLPPSEHAYICKVVETTENLFNKSLGSRLIYNFEHPQYREKTAEFLNMPMSRLYGFPYLLRMFHMVKYILDQKKLTNIGPAVADLEDIISYSCEHSSKYFVITDLYGVASADYTRLAQIPT